MPDDISLLDIKCQVVYNNYYIYYIYDTLYISIYYK